jgi:hypothetical protein
MGMDKLITAWSTAAWSTAGRSELPTSDQASTEDRFPASVPAQLPAFPPEMTALYLELIPNYGIMNNFFSGVDFFPDNIACHPVLTNP